MVEAGEHVPTSCSTRRLTDPTGLKRQKHTCGSKRIIFSYSEPEVSPRAPQLPWEGHGEAAGRDLRKKECAVCPHFPGRETCEKRLRSGKVLGMVGRAGGEASGSSKKQGFRADGTAAMIVVAIPSHQIITDFWAGVRHWVSSWGSAAHRPDGTLGLR